MKHLKISYENYTVFFLLVIMVVTVPAILIGLQLEPISGGLTRVGFYSENDFGWNLEEYKYEPPLREKGISMIQYDIVVIGDSFSNNRPSSQTPEGGYWTDIFAKETGLRVGVFHIRDQPALELIQAFAEREKPPVAIIYQTVERSLAIRLNKKKFCPEDSYSFQHDAPVFFKAMPNKPIPFQRNIEPEFFDIAYAMKYMFSKLTNHNFNKRIMNVRLIRNDLFSNKIPERMLFLNDDLVKSSWSIQDWERIKCNVLAMQNATQKNGKSRFVFMVAPDKSSIYDSFFEDGKLGLSKLHLLESEKLNFLRLDEILINHVENGTTDLYLPNDSHWSFKGHAIVAYELIHYLKE